MSELNIDREALAGVIFSAMDKVEQEAVANRRGYAQLSDMDGPVADAVLAFLADQPTPASDGHVCTTHCHQGKGHYPAPVDADAVERAEAAAIAALEDDESEGLTIFDLGVKVARAALAAARAGGVTVTGQASVVEQVAEELYRLDHTTLMGGLSAAAGWAQRRYRQRAEALSDAGLLASGPTLAEPHRAEMKGDDRG